MKRILCALFCILLLFSVCSCNTDPGDPTPEEIYKLEGGKKAFDSNVSSRVKTLKGKTIIYGTKDCSSDYKTAIKKAANNITETSSQITFKVDANSNTGNYRAGVYDSSSGQECYYNGRFYTLRAAMAANIPSEYFVVGANAFNNFTSNSSSSTIYFNREYMDDYTQGAKTMLAMHELGHTLGFIDFQNDTYVYKYDATVMKADYCSGYTVLTDYTEFDKKCITDLYGA
ncbi:MAG: hypothetical protein MJ070_07040 [Lachnospiraceae bacterium]|nr:hypothetical protein [Lachnospiraceae bacterium]